MNEKEHQRAADVEEARAKLLECFPGSSSVILTM